MMSTKRTGVQCYDSALPDEPIFCLSGRDPEAPLAIRRWAAFRQRRIDQGNAPPTDTAKVREAWLLALTFEEWRANHLADRRQLGFWSATGPEGSLVDVERRPTSKNPALAAPFRPSPPVSPEEARRLMDSWRYGHPDITAAWDVYADVAADLVAAGDTSERPDLFKEFGSVCARFQHTGMPLALLRDAIDAMIAADKKL